MNSREKIEYLKKYSNYPDMYEAVEMQGIGEGKEYDEVKKRLKEWKIEYEKIKAAIIKIENQDQSKFLYYKYIKKLSWKEISEIMNYSTTQLHRIRKRAIERIEL